MRVYAPFVCVWCLSSKEGTRPSWNWRYRQVWSAMWCWAPNLGPLQDQQESQSLSSAPKPASFLMFTVERAFPASPSGGVLVVTIFTLFELPALLVFSKLQSALWLSSFQPRDRLWSPPVFSSPYATFVCICALLCWFPFHSFIHKRREY